MIDDLRSLRAFIVTAEELNFRRAAERLHMSQPPLSRMIAGLEHGLETKLFERNTRSVNLTPAGIRFYKEALALLEQADGLARKMKSESQTRRRRFPIGCTAAAYCTEFPRIIAQLRELHPDAEIELHEMNSDAQLDALAAAKIDAGVILLPAVHQALEFAPFARIRMQMALPASHPMAERHEPLALADLRRDVFIVHTREENPAMYHEILHHCAKAGFRPKTLTKRKGQNCMAMVASGAGVHFTAATGRCASVEGVRFVPLAGDAPVLEMALAWRKGDEMPAIETLRSLISGC